MIMPLQVTQEREIEKEEKEKEKEKEGNTFFNILILEIFHYLCHDHKYANIN